MDATLIGAIGVAVVSVMANVGQVVLRFRSDKAKTAHDDNDQRFGQFNQWALQERADIDRKFELLDSERRKQISDLQSDVKSLVEKESKCAIANARLEAEVASLTKHVEELAKYQEENVRLNRENATLTVKLEHSDIDREKLRIELHASRNEQSADPALLGQIPRKP